MTPVTTRSLDALPVTYWLCLTKGTAARNWILSVGNDEAPNSLPHNYHPLTSDGGCGTFDMTWKRHISTSSRPSWGVAAGTSSLSDCTHSWNHQSDHHKFHLRASLPAGLPLWI